MYIYMNCGGNINRIYKVLTSFTILYLISSVFLNNIHVQAGEINEGKIYSNATINDKFSPDSVLVLLDEEASYSDKIYTVDDFNDVKCSEVTDLTKDKFTKIMSSSENSKDLNYKRLLCIELENSSKDYVLEVVNELIKRDDVLYAGPDYEISVSSTIPSDYNTNIQWASDTIDLPKVWDFSTGSNNVVVGVIDTGIDGNHPDLRDSIINDLCRDFSSGSEAIVTTPTDPRGHGTKVAGIIGAIGDNDIGCVGVNWEVGLVSLRVLNDNGFGYSSYVIKAIQYAERMGTPILNISLGWYVNSSSYDAAFDHIISTYSGLVICAAGNYGSNNDVKPFYPANCLLSNVISVGAHDKYDERSIWNSSKSSNYGADTVHIYAPGGKGNENAENCYTTTKNSTYGYFNGTSCAAPHVTGVAALLLSIDPNLTVTQIKSAILNSAETINITIPDGTTQSVKKLNAFNAVKYVLDNYAKNSYDLTSYGVSINKSINPSSSYFYEKNMFIKLNVSNSCEYEFTIVGNYSIDVKLYDASLNEITISKTVMEANRRITFSNTLRSSEYYISVFSSYSEPQIVDLSIQTNHTHSYTIYKRYNDTQHKALCSCGEYVLQYHMVDTDGRCVKCFAIVSSGINPLMLNNVTYITENGSYVLPNGVIIIVEVDIDSLKNRDFFVSKS